MGAPFQPPSRQFGACFILRQGSVLSLFANRSAQTTTPIETIRFGPIGAEVVQWFEGLTG